MPDPAIAHFVERLRNSRVLDGVQGGELAALAERSGTAPALAQELVRRGWLTAFQAHELLEGRDLILGPYVLQAELGKGGMGAVYQARHQMMKRQVALKVLRPGKMGGGAIRRFQQEIEAAAALSHPHIVTAHDAGRVGDVFYFAMEKLDGAALNEVLKKTGPLPVANACHYIRQAALGLHYAHERGMVHRDIKPGNLFLTRDNSVKILDMGLVRVPEAGKDALTQLGTVMGTPDYIAPEQALDSHEVDARADIYSLGCTLHHLLAGNPPFPGKGGISQKLERHLHEEPPSLSALRPEVPQALSAVVRKMLAKMPQDRFQRAVEVAAALEPFTRGAKPIPIPSPSGTVDEAESARAVTAIPVALVPGQAAPAVPVAAMPSAETSRKPLWWALGAGALLVLLVPVLWLAFREKPTDPIVEEHPSPRKREKKKPAATVRLLDRLKAEDVPEELRWKNQPMQLVAVLGDNRAIHNGFVLCATVSPDGKWIASGTYQAIHISDAQTLRPVGAIKLDNEQFYAMAFSPDGKQLAAGGGALYLWDLSNLAAPKQLWKGSLSKELITYVAFTPDNRIFTASHVGLCRMWDAGKGVELDQWGSDYKEKRVSRALSPDGRTVLFGDETGKVWLVDVKTKTTTDWDKHVGGIGRVAYSPDGKYAAIAGSNVVVVREVGTTKQQRIGKAEGGTGLHFLSGGRLLADLELWDYTQAVSKQRLRADSGQDSIRFVVPLHDESTVVVNDLRTLRLFDSASGQEVLPTAPHSTGIRALAFSPDGKYLISGGAGMGDEPPLVRVWDLDTLQEAYRLRLKVPGGRGGLTRLAVSHDSMLASVAIYNNGHGRAQTWSLRTGEDRHHADGYGAALTFSPDGKWLMVGQKDGMVKLVDAETGKPQASLKKEKATGIPSCVEVSADGTMAVTTVGSAAAVVIGDAPGEISFWSLPDGKLIKSWPFEKSGFWQVCLSSDKRYLYAGHREDGTLWIWDLRQNDAQPIKKEPGHGKSSITSIALSQDGRTLFTYSTAGTLIEWQVPEGKKQHEWEIPGIHGDAFQVIALSPDGRYLAVGRTDGRIVILRVGTGTG